MEPTQEPCQSGSFHLSNGKWEKNIFNENESMNSTETTRNTGTMRKSINWRRINSFFLCRYFFRSVGTQCRIVYAEFGVEQSLMLIHRVIKIKRKVEQ